MVDGEDGERGVDGLVGNRQRLGDAPGGGCRAVAALGEHHRARLDGDDPAPDGLVGAGARPDVHDGLRVAERPVDLGDDARVTAAVAGVPLADSLVEAARRYPLGGSPSLRWSQETYLSTWIFTTTRLCSICSTAGRNSSL